MQPVPSTPLLPDALLSDAAAHTQDEDEFQRYPFAQRIAATIRARRDAGSLVLSLYGKWGSGKTSVLNFIQRELAGSEVITMVFNPWLFSGEEQLLLGFFAEFGEKLAPLGPIGAQAATTAMHDYSRRVAARSGVLRQEATEEQAKAFEAAAALEGFKHQLREMLRGSGKRVLVLIDDIDRLDKHEIQALLRLVKLTADFPYTTYLLALDDDIVARSLSERYPGAGKAAGKRFLEKIIQVPLRLPVIQKEAMGKYFTKRLNQTLLLTDTQLPESALSLLAGVFSASILGNAFTPRDVNRYANTLSVVIPLLQGEANIVDLILIEALKTFHPSIYKLVATHQDAVTGVAPESGQDKLRERYEPLFGENANKLGNARRLVLHLFPKLQNLYTSFHFSLYHELYRTEDDLYKTRSIASAYYFKRYFSYAVQDGEIPEQSFKELEKSIQEQQLDQAYTQALTMLQRAPEGEFIQRLERDQPETGPQQAEGYCTLLIRLSENFSSEAITNYYTRLFARVPGLLLLYMQRTPEQKWLPLAQAAVQDSTPLFSYQFMHDLYQVTHWERQEELEPIRIFFTGDHFQQLAALFIDRCLQISGDKPIYQEYESVSPLLFDIWQIAYGKAPVNSYLQSILQVTPEELPIFLRYMSPAGSNGYGHLDANNYTQIAAIFDATALYQVAKQLVGDTELIPYVKDVFNPPNDERRLHEFIYLHNKAIKGELGNVP